MNSEVEVLHGELLDDRGRLNQAAKGRVRDELRRRVDGGRQLTAIATIIELLERGEERVYDPTTGSLSEAIPLGRERIAALNAALSARFKLLAKVLPDLRAVELTGEDGGPVELTGSGQSDKLVLATKLLAIMREGQQQEAN